MPVMENLPDHIPECGCVPCPVHAVSGPLSDISKTAAAAADCLILVAPSSSLRSGADLPDCLLAPVSRQLQLDAAAELDGAVIGDVAAVPGGRLVLAPTGPLERDYDDARRYGEAAERGIKRALAAGYRCPVLFTVSHKLYPQSTLIALLGALHALYVPLEVREHARRVGDAAMSAKAKCLYVCGSRQHEDINSVVQRALALEAGRFVARDIGGSDPERMAAPRVAAYVRHVLANTCVEVRVERDDEDNVDGDEAGEKETQVSFERQYPLFAAVNRAAKEVPRHRGRLVHLTYEGEGPITRTFMLVGKGVTYDTGGLDIKAGGVMAGMHRDKCGSAAVAGFFKTLSLLRPAGVRVLGVMCMVRNSVAADGYVSDEIITSRAGVRIRIGNTDAEGRMAMADLLCLMKERAVAQGEGDIHLLTVATLTGHACIACGEGYSSALDNAPAASASFSQLLATAGHLMAEPVEINTIRREDYAFHKGKSEYEDVLQCNNLASSRTPRGHQTPAAFLIMASGLDKHGRESARPLKYTHLDIAASAGPFPGVPTGAPILALSELASASQ